MEEKLKVRLSHRIKLITWIIAVLLFTLKIKFSASVMLILLLFSRIVDLVPTYFGLKVREKKYGLEKALEKEDNERHKNYIRLHGLDKWIKKTIPAGIILFTLIWGILQFGYIIRWIKDTWLLYYYDFGYYFFLYSYMLEGVIHGIYWLNHIRVEY